MRRNNPELQIADQDDASLQQKRGRLVNVQSWWLALTGGCGAAGAGASIDGFRQRFIEHVDPSSSGLVIVIGGLLVASIGISVAERTRQEINEIDGVLSDREAQRQVVSYPGFLPGDPIDPNPNYGDAAAYRCQ